MSNRPCDWKNLSFHSVEAPNSYSSNKKREDTKRRKRRAEHKYRDLAPGGYSFHSPKKKERGREGEK